MGQRLGQHFLSDTTILGRIRDQVFLLRDEKGIRQTIEVGPGQGALTKEIVGGFDKMVVMEADLGLEKHINRISKGANEQEIDFDVLWGDVLQADLSKFYENTTPSDWLVVGNLPYYITSPIFRQFFVDHTFLGGVFLIQKEVGEKIATDAKKKSYLWRLLRYTCCVEYNFTVPPGAFSPPPKVDSAVVTITQHGETYPFRLERLQQFLDIVSQFSRKTLGKIGKMRKEQLEEIGLEIPQHIASKRLEAVSWEEMCELLGAL